MSTHPSEASPPHIPFFFPFPSSSSSSSPLPFFSSSGPTIMVDEVGVCNSVFLLELGCAAETGAVSTGNRQRRQRESSMKLEPFMLNPVVPELSLTLGLSDTAFRQLSSATASLSASSNVKKEAEAGSEEAEKISARGSDDEDENGSRKKLRLTKEQSALLEEKFREHSTLNPKQKLALAKQLNLRPRQVEVWFQNRRARTKLKQTEVDCEFLRRCCESLTEENRRLHRELQELKAVQVPAAAAPLYMQLPPAMLKICPSCERVAGGNDRSKDSALAAASAAVTKKALFLNPFSHSTACWE